MLSLTQKKYTSSEQVFMCMLLEYVSGMLVSIILKGGNLYKCAKPNFENWEFYSNYSSLIIFLHHYHLWQCGKPSVVFSGKAISQKYCMTCLILSETCLLMYLQAFILYCHNIESCGANMFYTVFKIPHQHYSLCHTKQ